MKKELVFVVPDNVIIVVLTVNEITKSVNRQKTKRIELMPISPILYYVPIAICHYLMSNTNRGIVFAPITVEQVS